TSAASFVSALVARRAALPTALPLWIPFVGTCLYGGGAFPLLRSAWRLIGRRDTDVDRRAAETFRRAGGKASVSTTISAPLVARTSRAAFRRQLFQAATRDTGVLLALLFPLVIPVAALTGPKMSGVPINVLLYGGPIMAAVMGGWLLVHGLTRLQVGTGLLEASLPLIERDRAFPRLTLCAIIPAAGVVIAGLILFPPGLKLEGFFLSTIPVIAVPVGFLAKTTLFGRIRRLKPRRGFKSHVVVEEVYIDYRFFKWVGVITAVMIVAGGLVALRIVLTRVAPGPIGTGFYLASIALAALILRFIAGRVFPAAAPLADERQSADRPGGAAGR
ncbi:MAG: hypothetical protein KAU31_03865, partial [Spirochaetaceae bacterium]|nr:hypothetical protein [Spirochaetaceae bacterium]